MENNGFHGYGYAQPPDQGDVKFQSMNEFNALPLDFNNSWTDNEELLDPLELQDFSTVPSATPTADQNGFKAIAPQYQPYPLADTHNGRYWQMPQQPLAASLNGMGDGLGLPYGSAANQSPHSTIPAANTQLVQWQQGFDEYTGSQFKKPTARHTETTLQHTSNTGALSYTPRPTGNIPKPPTADLAGSRFRFAHPYDSAGSGLSHVSLADIQKVLQPQQPRGQLTAASDSKVKKPTGRRSRATQQDTSNIHPLTYEADPALNTAAACRDFISKIKIMSVKKLKIEDDNWEAVKTSHAGHYIGRIYHAFLEVPDEDPLYGPKLDTEETKGFRDQQKDGHVHCANRLKTALQQKVAKARSMLLFDAAIAVHERGIAPDDHDKAAAAQKSNRKRANEVPKVVDFSICSDRLDLIVQAIQSNKMVAISIIDGQNFDEITLNPIAYLRKKADLFKSNFHRQRKTAALKAGNGDAQGSTESPETDDGSHATDTPARPKRKRVAAGVRSATGFGGYSDDSTDFDRGEEEYQPDGDDDDYVTPPKAKRTKRAKKKQA